MNYSRANRSSRFTVSTISASVVLGLIVQSRSEATPRNVVDPADYVNPAARIARP